MNGFVKSIVNIRNSLTGAGRRDSMSSSQNREETAHPIEKLDENDNLDNNDEEGQFESEVIDGSDIEELELNNVEAERVEKSLNHHQYTVDKVTSNIYFKASDFYNYEIFSDRKSWGKPSLSLYIGPGIATSKGLIAALVKRIPDDQKFIYHSEDEESAGETWDEFIRICKNLNLLKSTPVLEEYHLAFETKAFQLIHFGSVSDFRKNRVIHLSGSQYRENLATILRNITNIEDYKTLQTISTKVAAEIRSFLKAGGNYPIKSKYQFCPKTVFSEKKPNHEITEDALIIGYYDEPLFGLPIFMNSDNDGVDICCFQRISKMNVHVKTPSAYKNFLQNIKSKYFDDRTISSESSIEILSTQIKYSEKKTGSKLRNNLTALEEPKIPDYSNYLSSMGSTKVGFLKRSRNENDSTFINIKNSILVSYLLHFVKKSGPSDKNSASISLPFVDCEDYENISKSNLSNFDRQSTKIAELIHNIVNIYKSDLKFENVKFNKNLIEKSIDPLIILLESHKTTINVDELELLPDNRDLLEVKEDVTRLCESIISSESWVEELMNVLDNTLLQLFQLDLPPANADPDTCFQNPVIFSFLLMTFNIKEKESIIHVEFKSNKEIRRFFELTAIGMSNYLTWGVDNFDKEIFKHYWDHINKLWYEKVFDEKVFDEKIEEEDIENDDENEDSTPSPKNPQNILAQYNREVSKSPHLSNLPLFVEDSKVESSEDENFEDENSEVKNSEEENSEIENSEELYMDGVEDAQPRDDDGENDIKDSEYQPMETAKQTFKEETSIDVDATIDFEEISEGDKDNHEENHEENHGEVHECVHEEDHEEDHEDQPKTKRPKRNVSKKH